MSQKTTLPKCFNRLKSADILDLAVELYEQEIKQYPSLPDNAKEVVGQGCILRARSTVNNNRARARKEIIKVQKIEEPQGNSEEESNEDSSEEAPNIPIPKKKVKNIVPKPEDIPQLPPINKPIEKVNNNISIPKPRAKRVTVFDTIIASGKGTEVYEYAKLHNMSQTATKYDLKPGMVKKIKVYYDNQ